MFFFFVCVTVIVYLICNVLTMRPKNFPPGPPLLPIIGSFYHAKRPNIHILLQKWKLKYGPLIGFIMYKRKYVIVCEPEQIMEVFKRPEFQGRSRSFIRDNVFQIHQQGIFFNDGPIWTDQRRFAFRMLRDYGFNKESIIEDEYRKWMEYTLKRGDTHQAQDLFKFPSANILWRSVAGEPRDYGDPIFDQMTHIIYDLMRQGTVFGITDYDILPFLSKLGPKFSQYDLYVEIFMLVKKFLKETVEKHRETLDPNHPRDVIDSYLIELDNDRLTFAEDGLLLLILDLFFPAADPLGNSISFMVLYMILYPEIQSKVHEEIDDILGDNRFSLKDRNCLPYCEAVMNEVNRMRTISPLGVSHRATCNTTLGEYVIPKDTDLITSIYSLLQDKEHWGDPENFRPERFLSVEDGRFIRDEWLLFFGLGKRVCVGESFVRNMQFIFFVSLFQDFTMSLPDGDPTPSTEPITGFTITHQPFQVKFTPRRKLLII